MESIPPQTQETTAFYPTVEQLEEARYSLDRKGYSKADLAEDESLVINEARRIMLADYEN